MESCGAKFPQLISTKPLLLSSNHLVDTNSIIELIQKSDYTQLFEYLRVEEIHSKKTISTISSQSLKYMNFIEYLRFKIWILFKLNNLTMTQYCAPSNTERPNRPIENGIKSRS